MRPESGPSRRALHDWGRTRRPAPGDPGARSNLLAPHAHHPGDRRSSASALPGRANPKPGRYPPRQRSAGGRLARGFRSIEPRPSRARDRLAPGPADAPRLVATQVPTAQGSFGPASGFEGSKPRRLITNQRPGSRGPSQVRAAPILDAKSSGPRPASRPLPGSLRGAARARVRRGDRPGRPRARGRRRCGRSPRSRSRDAA